MTEHRQQYERVGLLAVAQVALQAYGGPNSTQPREVLVGRHLPRMRPTGLGFAMITRLFGIVPSASAEGDAPPGEIVTRLIMSLK